MTHWIPNRRPRKRAQLGLAFDPGAKRAPITIIDDSASEAAVQRAILDLLAVHPRVAFHFRTNTASGFLVPAKTWKALLAGVVARAMMARYMRFAFPGCSDILGMLKGGKFLAIEVKGSMGEATEDQTAFLAAVNANGGLGILVRSVDDVLRALEAV